MMLAMNIHCVMARGRDTRDVWPLANIFGLRGKHLYFARQQNKPSSLCFVGQGQGHADHVCIMNEVIQLGKLGIQLFLLLLRQVLVVKVAQLLQAKALQAVGSKLGRCLACAVSLSACPQQPLTGLLASYLQTAVTQWATDAHQLLNLPVHQASPFRKSMTSCTRLLPPCFQATQSPRNPANSAYNLLTASAPPYLELLPI